jgi:hypothetical protein
VLVAAKLLAWPLILWLLVTRRFRNALIAIGSTVTVLALSWAPIGFTGVTTYPRLLAADAHAWQERSYSLVAAFMRLGAPDTIARGLAAATACMVAVEIVRTVGMSDQAWFVAALGFGLLVSPLLELSYLTVLFVALTILRPRLDRFWLLPAALWLAPPGLLPQMAQVAIVIAVLIVTLVRATGAERHPLRALLSSRLA